jgi:hypothetical protein
MDMETEIQNGMIAAIERLARAAELLEQAAQRLAARETEISASADATLERVVATVESDLAVKLAAAEERIAELEARASHEPVNTGRKTVAATANLAAKHGVAVDGINAGALDAALVHLSLEQRIAVKAELLRAGFVG